jgi:hypothetical protein
MKKCYLTIKNNNKEILQVVFFFYFSLIEHLDNG